MYWAGLSSRRAIVQVTGDDLGPWMLEATSVAQTGGPMSETDIELGPIDYIVLDEDAWRQR